jgi:DNA polymerase-3 subunit delta
MKRDAARFDRILADLANIRAILLHGDDEGLIREFAQKLVVAVAGSTNDPFLVSDIERDRWSQLADEVAAQSLLGGRRVVRVRDVTDAAAAHIDKALKVSGGGLLVLEGPGLTGRSKVKTSLEQNPATMTIACYPMDTKSIGQLARQIFRDAGVSVDDETIGFLSDQLGVDRASTRQELDKLALYAGQNGTVDLEAARICIGDLSGLQLEDALYAATSGDVAATDRALELAIAEGATAISIIRAGLFHLQRLARAAILVAEGLSQGAAVKAMRPPIHFKREAQFSRAMALWNFVSLQSACGRLWEVEKACKRTGAPAEALSRSIILGLAQRAAAAKRR